MPQVLGKEYKVFSGDNTYRILMPQLIEASLVPMNMADVMRARLECFKKSWLDIFFYIVKGNKLKQKEFWSHNYVGTADGVTYYKDKIKVVHDAQALREIQRRTRLSSGALILTPEQYKDLEGEEFSRSDLEKIGVEKRLTKSEVKSNPIWKSLARDNHLLSEYADLIFAEVKKRYNWDDAMGIYLGSEQENPTMRAWFVDYLWWSDASCDGNLDNDALLVGVRAEGVSKKETLDEKVIN